MALENCRRLCQYSGMSATETYTIGGMTCQNCANGIQRTVSWITGVANVSVTFATESMTLERASGSPDAIVKAVEDLGYRAALRTDKKKV